MSEEVYEFGTFLKRENRFIAQVEVGGKTERVHVPNTGRLPQILLKGVKVQLRKSNNPNRKTKYSLIAAMKGSQWINIDSQLPNKLAFDSIEQGFVKEFAGLDLLKREVSYGNSRFDLYYEKEDRKGFIEVKGETYAENQVGMFPDAPTTRGTKHIYELIKAVEAGYEGAILFLIMREDCTSFSPYRDMDADFSDALKTAADQGVEVLAYKTTYDGTRPIVQEKVPIVLK